MKILHISTEKSWRGGEQQIAYLIEGLRHLGVENFVVCRTGSPFQSWCEQNNVKFEGLPCSGSIDLRTSIGIGQYAIQNSIDLVHAHTAKAHGLVAIATLFSLKAPIVVHRRVAFPIRKNWFTQWKYNRPQIKKIICISEAVQAAATAGNIAKDKLAKVYSSIDIEQFREIKPNSNIREVFNISEKAFLIGNTSAFSAEKDLSTFVRTAAILLQQHASPLHFMLMGDGPLKDTIAQEIGALGLRSYFTLTGFRKDVKNILPELDLFLMTSTSEGLGTSLLDALASKIPVVATNVGGIPEIIIDEKTGLLAAPGDAEQLASKCSRVLQDAQLASTFVTGGTDHLEKFSIQKMSANTLLIYQKILA